MIEAISSISNAAPSAVVYPDNLAALSVCRGLGMRNVPVTVFACGPPPMLEAVRAICAERATPAQLALESGMACGFGACFGCVVETRDGYIRLCVDGPVLDADTLESAL